MRRKDKQITQISDIEEIIGQSSICRLALSDNNMPYIVPVNFGYKDNTIYIHGATEGKKINILTQNPNVCFEFETDTQLIEGDNSCNWSMRYKSVIGYGIAGFIQAEEKKQNALDIIMAQYSDNAFQFSPKATHRTCVIKIAIDRMTGKQSGF